MVVHAFDPHSGGSVDQAGLKLRDPPASASKRLGLKVCTTAWARAGLNYYTYPLSSVSWHRSVISMVEASLGKTDLLTS